MYVQTSKNKFNSTRPSLRSYVQLFLLVHFRPLFISSSAPAMPPPPSGTDCQAVQPLVEGSSLRSLGRDTAMLLSDLTQGASNWIQSYLDPSNTSGGRRSLQSAPGRSQQHVESSASAASCEGHLEYPEGFAPLRSECRAFVSPTSCPIIRNPFVSPLLAPTELLRGLPPVYIVVRGGSCGLDL